MSSEKLVLITLATQELTARLLGAAAYDHHLDIHRDVALALAEKDAELATLQRNAARDADLITALGTRAEAAEAMVAEKDKALAYVSRVAHAYWPNDGSTTSLVHRSYVINEADKALALTPADMIEHVKQRDILAFHGSLELKKLRGYYADIVKSLGHDLVIREIDALRARVAELESCILRTRGDIHSPGMEEIVEAALNPSALCPSPIAQQSAPISTEAEPPARLAKSNHVIFAESAAFMKQHGAPPYMAERMTSLALLAKTHPGEAARVLPAIRANLHNETEIK